MRAFLVQIGMATALAVSGGHLLALWFGVRAPSLTGPFFVLALTLVGTGAIAALVGYVFWLAFWEREPNPSSRVIATVRRCLTPECLARRMAPLVLTFLFLGAYGTFKALMFYIHPFAWDGFLSDLDRTVFGTDPWRITHALIGPLGTRFIDIFYGLWFVEWNGAIIYFSLFARAEQQRRFFLSFFGIWAILGVFLATLLSSAGPCYLELIGHPYAGRYADLLPIPDAPGAMRAQNLLAGGFQGGLVGPFQGISAMPSIHVAVSALLALAAWQLSRPVFIFALLFWAIIFLGSVHLGWHYVSDGLVGSLGALAIWHVTGKRSPTLTFSAISAERTT